MTSLEMATTGVRVLNCRIYGGRDDVDIAKKVEVEAGQDTYLLELSKELLDLQKFTNQALSELVDKEKGVSGRGYPSEEDVGKSCTQQTKFSV